MNMLTNTSTNKILKNSFWGLGLLAIASIVALLLPESLLSRTQTFTPLDYPARLSSDVETGGTSRVSWVDKASQVWKCETFATKTESYCSIIFSVADGLDLSTFDEMMIQGEYEGSENFITLYLRNKNPAYYVPGVDISTKYNAITIPTNKIATGVTVKNSYFNVASWWIKGGNIPFELSKPEFNDIIFIEAQIAPKNSVGSHIFQLKKIEWVSFIVSKKQMYQLILLTWAGCMLAYIIFILVITRVSSSKENS